MAAEPRPRLQPEDVVSAEWAEWYRMTPAERWEKTAEIWETYLALGGSLEPEYDPQSPFNDVLLDEFGPEMGRPKLKMTRRGGL